MKEGISVQLEMEKKIRVQNILNEYGPAGKESFLTALNKLNKRLPTPVIQQLEALLHEEDYIAFITLLLDYYDTTSNYNTDSKQRINVPVSGNNPYADAKEVLTVLERFGIVIS
jgi:hypothetical protein